MPKLTRLLTALAFALAPLASAVPVPVLASSCALTVGEPFRTPQASTVYVVVDGCTKRPVFNPDVYFSHFASWSETTFVSPGVLGLVPDSPLRFLPWGPRRSYPDGSLIKVVTDPKVYVLEAGKRRPIKDEATFRAHGYKFSDVLDVTDPVLARFPEAGELNDASVPSHQMPDGSMMDMPMNPAPATPATMPMSGMPHLDLTAINAQGHAGLSYEKVGPAGETIYYTDGVGAFRSQCQFSQMRYDDPLVFPGQPGASHLHVFFGNADIDASTTAGHLRDPGTTGTCAGGTANLSGYWVPDLLDAKGNPVAPVRNIVYYKSGYNGIKPADIREFPEGLRMIAGDAKSSATQEHAYWGCGEVYVGHPGSIPTCPSGTEFIEMTVEFPQCWNGKDLDSPNHKDHMAYPSGGHCPADHPVPIPAISFNVRYKIPPEGTAGMRLASDMYSKDMPGGFSAHGDWWDGWDHAIVKQWMKNCVNAGMDCRGGLISDTQELAY